MSGYPPQGTGISTTDMRTLLKEERKKLRRWQIIAIILAIITIIEPFLFHEFP